MQLTKTQITQANELIKKYKFCTLETQRKLKDAGFFQNVEVLSYIAIAKTSGIPVSVLYIEDVGWAQENEHYAFIPFPQFEEVWNVLPDYIIFNYGKAINANQICYYNISNRSVCIMIHSYDQKENPSTCEAACQMWLKLKENNLL